jgi:hypothetical protein
MPTAAAQPRCVRVQRAFQCVASALLLLTSACAATSEAPNPILGRWVSDESKSSRLCHVFVHDIEFQTGGKFLVSDGRGQYRLLDGNQVRLYHTSQIVWKYEVSESTLTLELVSGLEPKGVRCVYQKGA